jgi:uncharacterized pyridoxamine 5'-phosphate oxidase family protein
MNIDTRARRRIANSLVVRLATLSGASQPRLTPLWFIFDRGRFYMNTRAASPAVRDIASHPEVVLLFDRDRPGRSSRVLRIRGRAEFRQDTKELNGRMYLFSALKYHLSLGGLRNLAAGLASWPVRLRYYKERAGEAGTIEVIPETIGFVLKP